VIVCGYVYFPLVKGLWAHQQPAFGEMRKQVIDELE